MKIYEFFKLFVWMIILIFLFLFSGLDLLWGLNSGPVIISKIKSIPLPASKITFKFLQPTDIPEKLEHFTTVLQYQFVSKLLHENSKIIINFYGKKLKIIIISIASLESSKDKNFEDKIVKLVGDLKLDDSDNSFISCLDNNLKFYKVVESTKWCLKIDVDNVNSVGKSKISLDDIGGYETIIDDLRQVMMYSLKKSGITSLRLKSNTYCILFIKACFIIV